MKLTKEFKNLNLTKYPYSISAILLYIISLDVIDGRIKIKIYDAFPKMGMSVATLSTGLKELRNLRIIKKDGQSHYIINKEYINYDN